MNTSVVFDMRCESVKYNGCTSRTLLKCAGQHCVTAETVLRSIA